MIQVRRHQSLQVDGARGHELRILAHEAVQRGARVGSVRHICQLLATIILLYASHAGMHLYSPP